MLTADRYQRAKEVFLAACETAGIDRDAFVAIACAGDDRLAEDVREMLRADAEAERLEAEEAERDKGLIGRTIGRYRVLSVIGEGGMGVVYEAEQESPARTVALKIVRPEFATASALRRFEAEARALGRLQHPGIAQIFEAGRARIDDRTIAYFAMELVRGKPLKEHARTLSARERMRLVGEIGGAVQHAHQKGVVHRDLKPPNILVDARGHPKVLDFGIARVFDEADASNSVRTRAGQVLGTIEYMSPEQAGGEAGADTRSDVYALGVILYELLADAPPHDLTGKTLHESLRIVREVEPARLGVLRRELRGDPETIVARAMDKEPGRRYPSAAAFAEDIRRFLNDEPILARPQSTVDQLRRFTRRNKAFVGAVAIAFAALGAATLISVRQASIAIDARKLADEKTELATQVAVRATLGAARAEGERANTIAALALLESIPEERRQWEWRHAAAQLDTSEALIQTDAPVLAAGFDADGRVITFTASGRVQRWDPYQTSPLSAVPLGAEISGAGAMSANLERACGVVAPGVVAIWDLRSGTQIETLKFPAADTRILVMSPDGSRIAAGGTGSWVSASLHSSGAAIVSAPDARAMAFSKDGLRLAAGYTSFGRFCDFSPETGERLAEQSNFSSIPVTAIDMSRDGGLMAIGTYDKRVFLFDTLTREGTREYSGHTGPVRAIALERGEQRIASGSDDGTVRVWDLRTGGSRVFTGHRGPVHTVAFSPSGERILGVSGSEVRVWKIDEHDPGVLRGHSSYVYSTAFIAGGRRMVSGAWDRTVRIWDPWTREEIAALKAESNMVAGIAAALGDRDGASSWFATVSNSGRVRLTSGDTGEHRPTLVPQPPQIHTAISVSADGRTMAVRSRAEVWLIDVPSWSITDKWACASRNIFGAVAVSPDGRLVASERDDGAVVVRDVLTGRERIFSGHAGAACALAFDPVGARLASGGLDRQIRVWDVADGRCLSVIEGHEDSVYALAFSPDGRRLASGSNDTTLRLWDVASGEQVALLAGHTDYIFSVAFSPGGELLITASGDSTLRVWDTEPWHIRMRQRAAMRALRGEAQAALLESSGSEAGIAAFAGGDPDRAEAARQVLLRPQGDAGPSGEQRVEEKEGIPFRFGMWFTRWGERPLRLPHLTRRSTMFLMQSTPARLLSAAALFAACGTSQAKEIIVPTQMSLTVAIASADPGDTITLLPSGSPYQQFPGLSVTKNLHIRGSTGNPEDVVITGSDLDRVLSISTAAADGTIVEGLTIQNGLGPTGANSSGSGIYIVQADVTVRNCIIKDNYMPATDGNGSGLYATSSNLVVEDTIFMGNTIGSSDGDGAGMYLNASNAVIRNCHFEANIAEATLSNVGSGGGGAWVDNGTYHFIQCTFEENIAEHGGGLHCGSDGVTTLDACIFDSNTARYGGGLLTHTDSISTTVRNSIFDGNIALQNDSAVRADAPTHLINATITKNASTGDYVIGSSAPNRNVVRVDNSILWDNTYTNGQIAGVGTNAPIIRHSILQASYSPGNASTANFVADPLFADSAGGNYRLSPNSPAIDAGNTVIYSGPLADADVLTRGVDVPGVPDTGISILGPVIDIGAFEFQVSGGPACYANCDGSTNAPVLNVADFGCFLTKFAAGCP